jgi:hypothetical protein
VPAWCHGCQECYEKHVITQTISGASLIIALFAPFPLNAWLIGGAVVVEGTVVIECSILS